MHQTFRSIVALIATVNFKFNFSQCGLAIAWTINAQHRRDTHF